MPRLLLLLLLLLLLVAAGPLVAEEDDLLAALEQARQNTEVNPEDADAAFTVAELLVRLGAPAEALDMLARVGTLEPRGHRAPLLAALVLRDVERHGDALAILDRARADGIEHPELDQQRILLRLTLDRAEEAATLAAEAITHHPEHAGIELAAGLAFARRAAEAPATSTDSTDDTVEGSGQEALRRRASHHLRRALELGVEDPGRVELELGSLLLDTGRPAEARSHLEAAIAADPSRPEAHYRLGLALRALGETEAAREALDRFRQLGGNRDDTEHADKTLGTRLNAIQSLASSNQLDEALDATDLLIEERPNEGRVHALRAKILFSLNRRPQAVEAITRARELLPAYAEHHYLEGYFLLHLGKVDPAAEAFERAIAITPDLARAHALLAGIDAERGELEAAARRFERAFALGLEDPAMRGIYERVQERLRSSAGGGS